MRDEVFHFTALVEGIDAFKAALTDKHWPAGNRFQQHRALLQRVINSPGTMFAIHSADIEHLRSAIIDLAQLSDIMKHIDVRSSRWEPRAIKLTSGHKCMRDDKNRMFRSIQSEMYVASRLARVNVRPKPHDLAQSPDFDILLQNWRVGVEVKRVRSFEKVPQDVCEASHQLKRARRVGLIALDLTDLVNVGPFPQFNGDDVVQRVAEQHLLRILGDIRHRCRNISRLYVCGILIYYHAFFYDLKLQCVNTACAANLYFPWDDEDPRKEKLELLQAAVCKADRGLPLPRLDLGRGPG